MARTYTLGNKEAYAVGSPDQPVKTLSFTFDEAELSCRIAEAVFNAPPRNGRTAQEYLADMPDQIEGIVHTAATAALEYVMEQMGAQRAYQA